MSAKKRINPSRSIGSRPTSGMVPPPPRTRRSPAFIAIAVAAVVGLLGIVAVVATSSKSKTEDSVASAVVETAPVKATGTPLAEMADAGPDPSIGATAPRLDGSTFARADMSIIPGSGPLVIMFIAHWCPHCQREVPLVAAWANGGTHNGVPIRAIATATSKDNPNYPPSAWLTKENFTVPTMVDDEIGTAAKAYGLTSFPYFVALNGSGKVVARMAGEITEEQFNQLTSQAKAAQ
jgi:cytochrome c biogenesis protein CcmG, thiol:disulfide interchange protein DsbE